MAKYLLIIGGVDPDKRTGNPEMFAQYMAWLSGIKERGQYVGSGKLQNQIGRRLTVRGGEVIDGPFIESKDAVGGYVLIEAPSLDTAAALARGCPGLSLNGYVEVRLVEENFAARQ
jgi:hypothetical protein